MLLFKLYASHSVTLHPPTGQDVEKCIANVNTYKWPEREKEPQCSLCHRKRMELFSYQTRSGWLPRLSLLPCSWQCKCNLLHPLSWHLLLSILNHPRSGCTYHPFQGRCCYCNRGKKRKKTWQGSHHKCLLTLLEGPTNISHRQWSVWGFYLRNRTACIQQRLGDQKAVLWCMPRQHFHSFCLPQLSFGPHICVLRRSCTNLLMMHV